jgi:hypothetical protein
MNDKSHEITKSINTEEFKKNGIGEIIRTSGNMSDGENIKSVGNIEISNGSFDITLIQNSITTIIFE